jgi:putative ABC transport system permease protein
VSLGVPVVASLIPVFKGTRITVREAMDSAGIQQSGGSSQQRGWFGRGCAALMQAISSVMSRPLLISLRNTLRRKGRVALTLVTLTLGGAVFIAVLSVQSSLDRTVDDLLHSLYGFDMQVTLEDPERAAQVVTEVQRVPGVAVAESWSLLSTRRVLADGGEGESLTLFGVPPETQMMHPTITEGRWLLPDDESALVVSVEVLKDNPDLGVGDTMTLTINDREEQWTIVGAMVTMQGMPNVYTPFDYFGRVTHDMGRTRMVMVKTAQSDMAFVSTVAEELEAHLQRWSIEVSSIILMPEQRDSTKMMFNMIVGALLAMALIIAAVGGLGLAGTMSLNVLERTREIGVMRAIGASNAIVLQVVMLEGIILGLISWGIGALLAFPMSTLLIGTVGTMLLGTSLSFAFSMAGLWIWLAVVVVLAAVASFVPAWNAAQISVREVLAHE